MLSPAAVNSLNGMISPCRTPLLILILLLSLCRFRFPSEVRCTHLPSYILEARSVLFEFAQNRRLSHSRWMRFREGYYIICTSPSVGLRRGCGLSLSIRVLIQLALVAGFRRVSSLALSLVLWWILYRCLIVDISVCNSWSFVISILEEYHHLSVLSRFGYSSFW